MSVRTLVINYAQESLNAGGRVSVDAIARGALADLSDELAEGRDDLFADWVRRVVRDYLRQQGNNDEDGQMGLPGLYLPAAICVRSEDGTYYVRSDMANRVELRAGRMERLTNVRAAQDKLDQYDETVQLLDPYMTDDTITVREAYELYAAVHA